MFNNSLFSPDLTWRDVMYITVLGSRAYAIPSNTPLIRNAAGYNGKIIDFFFFSFTSSCFQSVVNMVLV
jgi:hypothetical protein